MGPTERWRLGAGRAGGAWSCTTIAPCSERGAVGERPQSVPHVVAKPSFGITSMAHRSRCTTLFRTRDLELVRFQAEYDAPYAVVDHEVVPSVSFVREGVFQYSVGSDGTWLHAGAVLVEGGDVEYTVTKPRDQRRDVTVSIRLLSTEARGLLQQKRGRVYHTRTRSAEMEVGLRRSLAWAADGPDAAVEAEVVELIELLRGDDERPIPHGDPHALRMIERARERIHSGYGEVLGLCDIADAACMSPFHFNRLFKRLMGMTPYRYLLQVRIAGSKQLLRAGMPSSECAYRCGFGSPSHFTNTFRALTGTTPGAFAKSNILQPRT